MPDATPRSAPFDPLLHQRDRSGGRSRLWRHRPRARHRCRAYTGRQQHGYVTASPSVSGCQGSADFWATSQAAPVRRVQVNGFFTLQDYCTAGPQFASGGFIADSVFHGSTVLNGSQQQFIVRNSNLDGWTNGVWNQVFAGDNGALAQAVAVPGGVGPFTPLAARLL